MSWLQVLFLAAMALPLVFVLWDTARRRLLDHRPHYNAAVFRHHPELLGTEP
jgi:hypothetical protein